jgi:hypothetical protein
MITAPFLRTILAACMLAVTVTETAQAQNEPGGAPDGQRERGRGRRGEGRDGRGGFGGMMQVGNAMLLQVPAVREELQLTDAQNDTIDAALESYRDERRSFRPDREKMQSMSEDERIAFMEKMRTDGEMLNQKTDAILSALMEPGQVERLNQISLQMRLNMQVTAALKSDSLKTALGISDEQVKQLDDVDADLQERRESARSAIAGGDREAMREQFEKMRQETMDQALAVLTAEQKTKLDEMKGMPIEIDLRSIMDAGRGRGSDGGERTGRRRDPSERDGGGRRRPGSDDAN